MAVGDQQLSSAETIGLTQNDSLTVPAIRLASRVEKMEGSSPVVAKVVVALWDRMAKTFTPAEMGTSIAAIRMAIGANGTTEVGTE
jgi:hypothetical protein